MITARVRSLKEYQQHLLQNALVYNRIRQIENSLEEKNSSKHPFTVRGYSYPIAMAVDFVVDHQYTDKGRINWRERVICPITSLNSRIRACIQFLDFELAIKVGSKVYIAEQLTPLYYYLHTRYPDITGSEFLGPDVQSGFVNENGIRHEDATRLSFKDNELDYYLSFECFEHIPDYLQAFRESFRVLKKGGMLYWTIPFSDETQENIVRATINADGSINHLLEPEYHGDPVKPEGGILCFTNFGWQLLDQLRDIGFSDAWVITYWSDALGYYGKQFLFCAVK